MGARNDRVKKYLLCNCTRTCLEEVHSIPPENLDNAIIKTLAIWFEPNTEPFEACLLIEDSVAKYFEGKDTNGSLGVVVTITHEIEVTSTIKGCSTCR